MANDMDAQHREKAREWLDGLVGQAWGEHALPSLTALLQAVADEARREEAAKHMDLIMQVVRKFPGETRHETAKRYIMEAEARASESSEAKSEVKHG